MNRFPIFTAVLGLSLFSVGAYAVGPAFKIHAAHVPGEVLVKFRSLPGQASDVAAAHAAIGAQTMDKVPSFATRTVTGGRLNVNLAVTES